MLEIRDFLFTWSFSIKKRMINVNSDKNTKYKTLYANFTLSYLVIYATMTFLLLTHLNAQLINLSSMSHYPLISI